jgi:hypothetical protein
VHDLAQNRLGDSFAGAHSLQSNIRPPVSLRRPHRH